MQVRVQVATDSQASEWASSGTGTVSIQVSTRGDRLRVGARVSMYHSTPSRCAACLGVWGRGGGSAWRGR